MKMSRNLFVRAPGALLAGAVLIFAGCGGNPKLEPAPEATPLPGSAMGAVSTVDNVHVTVKTEAWNGDQMVESQVTPLKVTIENNSSHPVNVRYDDFKLVGPKGTTFAALPPYGVTGSVEEPRLIETYPAILEPDFDYDRFEIAPYYSTIYPDMTVWASPFYYDPIYYDQYYTYWQTVDLPTPHMLAVALPDGVIQEGGSVSGFIYFERVSDKVPSVRFEYQLTDAASGKMFGTINIPFVVKE